MSRTLDDTSRVFSIIFDFVNVKGVLTNLNFSNFHVWGLKEVWRAISVLEDFSPFSNFGEAMMKSLKDLNQIVEKDVLNAQKQTLISDFFSQG